MAVAPDGSWLASGGVTGRCGSGMWPPGRNGRPCTGHAGAVAAVAVAPDGSWLASGGYDGTVRIWDVATGPERAALRPHRRGGGGGGGAGWQLAGLRRLGQDGADLGCGHRAANGPLLTGHTGWVAAVAVAPDGSWLASGGGRDGADLGRGHRAGAGHPQPATPAGGGGGGGAGWQLAGLRRLMTGRCGSGMWPPGGNGPPWKATPSRVSAVAVAPDGSWLASGGWDGTVRIWDVATGRERAVLHGHTGG